MDELVKLVSEKTGLSEDMSQKAVEAVLDFLKTKMPDPVVGILEKVLDGGDGIGLEDVASELKDVFKFP